jgi:hypothetical protein
MPSCSPVATPEIVIFCPEGIAEDLKLVNKERKDELKFVLELFRDVPAVGST